MFGLFGIWGLMSLSGSDSSTNTTRRAASTIEEDEDMLERSWTVSAGRFIERYYLHDGKKVDVLLKKDMSSHIEGGYFYVTDADDVEVFIMPAHQVKFKQTLKVGTKRNSPVAEVTVKAKQ